MPSYRTVLAAGGLAIAVALPLEAAAQNFKAKSAGDVVLRARTIRIVPAESSSVGTIGGDVEVDEAFTTELDFTYFATDNIGFELIAATANHDVELENSAAGDLDLGDVWLLPPTLTAQYHFRPAQRISPYLGAGINWTLFYGADSGDANDIDYENAVGPAFQAGVDVAISGNWSLNFDVKKIFLDTTAAVTVGGTTVDADVDIDPWIFGIGVGYRF